MAMQLRRQRSTIYSKSMVNKQILRRSCFVHLFNLRKATTARNMGDKGSHDVCGDCFWDFWKDRYVFHFLVLPYSLKFNAIKQVLSHSSSPRYLWGWFCWENTNKPTVRTANCYWERELHPEKKVCWVSLHLTWKNTHTHTCKLQKESPAS